MIQKFFCTTWYHHACLMLSATMKTLIHAKIWYLISSILLLRPTPSSSWSLPTTWEISFMKYFSKKILLPTDMLEYCQFAMQLQAVINSNVSQVHDASLLGGFSQEDYRKQIYFSKELQACIKQKFRSFSIFHIGKYCSEVKRKSTVRKITAILKPEKKKQRKKSQC